MRIDLSNLEGINRSDQNKIEKLKQGDTVKARVISVDGDTVKLDLGRGEIVEAKLDAPVDLKEGKLLNFLIKDLKEGTLVMRPLYEDVDTGSDFVLKNKSAIMDRILNLNNLSSEEKNVDIIKNMISYKMPLKQEDIKTISKYTDKLLSLLSLSEGETLETLVESELSPIDIDINKLIKVSSKKEASETLETEIINEEVKENKGTNTQESQNKSNKLEKNNLFKEASLEFLKRTQNANSKQTSIVVQKNIEVVDTSFETKVIDTKSLQDAVDSLMHSSQPKGASLDTPTKTVEVKSSIGETFILDKKIVLEALKNVLDSVDNKSTESNSLPLNTQKNIEVINTNGETKIIDTKTLTDAVDTLIQTKQAKNIDLNGSLKAITIQSTDGEQIVLDSKAVSEALETVLESIDTNTKTLTDEIDVLPKTLQVNTETSSRQADNLKQVVMENLTNDSDLQRDEFKALSSLIRETEVKSQEESTALKDIIQQVKQTNTETIRQLDTIDVTEVIKNELKTSFNEDHETQDLIQKLTFLIKSDVEVTTGNLTRLNKFLEQNKTINNDLIDVLELAKTEGIIDEKSKLDLMNKVETLNLKFDGTDSNKLKEFQSNLKEVSDKLLTSIKSNQESSEELNLKAKNLNEDINFLNKINDKNTLMLIPFTMNQRELENNLYVLSKRRVSKKSDNIKVYMNLNTNSLESVKVLCDYSQGKLNVDFKVKDNYVKLFEERKVELQTILESKGYENTVLHVSRQQGEKILDIISHDDTINYMLNIKV